MNATVTRHPVRLAIFSTPDHLCVVRAAAETLCRKMGFDDAGITKVVLSVDEALTNVIRHAYGGAEDQPIEVELSAGLEEGDVALRVRVRDFGRYAGACEVQPREPSALRPGGLGVYIMHECMDRVEYRQAEGGGTLLTMTKRLSAPRGGS